MSKNDDPMKCEEVRKEVGKRDEAKRDKNFKSSYVNINA